MSTTFQYSALLPKYAQEEDNTTTHYTVSASTPEPPPYTFFPSDTTESDDTSDVSISIGRNSKESDAWDINVRKCVASSRVLMNACRNLGFRHFSRSKTSSSNYTSPPERTTSLKSSTKGATSDKYVPWLQLDGLPHPESFHIIAAWIQTQQFPSKGTLINDILRSGQSDLSDGAIRQHLRRTLRGLIQNAEALEMVDAFWMNLGNWLGSPLTSADSEPKLQTTTTNPSRTAPTVSSVTSVLLKDIQSALFVQGVNPVLPRVESMLRAEQKLSFSSYKTLWSEAVLTMMTSTHIHHLKVPSSFIHAFLSSSRFSWGSADRLALVLWWARGRGFEAISNDQSIIMEAQHMVAEHIDIGDVPLHAAASIRDLLTVPWEAIVGGLVMGMAKAS